MPRKLEDLCGQRFGRLTVKKYAGKVNGRSSWDCVCDCGSKVCVSNNNLKRSTRSCGCLQKEKASSCNLKDISNQVFGKLTAISWEGTKGGNSYWKCKCECGNTTTVSLPALNAGQKSCGCEQGWFRSDQPGLWKDQAAYARWRRQDPIRKLRHGVSCSIRSMLKRNGSYKRKKSIMNHLPYTIEELKSHLESLWEPWMNWENYGGRSNDSRKTWHIDHKIPHCEFSYKSMEDPVFVECWSLSNLQPMEKKANMSKGKKVQAKWKN